MKTPFINPKGLLSVRAFYETEEDARFAATSVIPQAHVESPTTASPLWSAHFPYRAKRIKTCPPKGTGRFGTVLQCGHIPTISPAPSGSGPTGYLVRWDDDHSESWVPVFDVETVSDTTKTFLGAVPGKPIRVNKNPISGGHQPKPSLGGKPTPPR